jgi:PPK2 family polyphosphate:nucleotide phosphotransferase
MAVTTDVKQLEAFIAPFLVPHNRKVSLAKQYDPGYVGGVAGKAAAQDLLRQGIALLSDYQERLYAQNRYALLIIFQAMDAAGKDGVIKHVMTGLNPQGVQVTSFKAPSTEELDHDYLWRNFRALPGRGQIGIFNRSYYEEVLIVRVHPEILARQRLPDAPTGAGFWKRRFQEINNFEHYLVDNGIIVLKFFLNVSKEEQRQRFLERIDRPEKNWKFAAADVKERAHWDTYMAAYEDAFNQTSTPWAPWYIIPADHKWFTRLAVAAVISERLERIDLQFPTLSEEQKAQLMEARQLLERETKPGAP